MLEFTGIHWNSANTECFYLKIIIGCSARNQSHESREKKKELGVMGKVSMS